MKLFRSPFDKLSLEYQQNTADATMVTAVAVSPGGALFMLFSDMNKHLKQIAENTKGGSKVQVSGRSAKAIGAAMPGIGKGVKLIAEALNLMPDGEESQKKMNAIATGVDALSALGGAIFKFAGMLALSLPLLILGIPALLLAVPMIAIVGGLFWMLGKLGITAEIKEVATGLAIAGLAIVALAGGLVLAEMILSYAGSPLKTFATVALIVLGTGILFTLVGAFSSLIKRGAITMLIATLPILAIAISLAIFSAAVPPTAEGWITIGQVGATITGLGLVMAAAGLASAFIAPGAAVMILSGLALLSIALGISAMSKVLKTDMFSKGGIFADSGNTTKGVSVLGITIIEGGRAMSNLEWALLSVARSFMLPPLAIAGMYAGAPALIMSGIALLSIAKGIEKFQSLDIDYEFLPIQIGKVVTVLGKAFGEVGRKYPGGGGGILAAIAGSGEGTSLVAQGISSVMGMGRALSGIAAGVQNMALLRIPTKWDKHGNPIEFRQLTEADFIAVGENTKRIVLALTQTFSEVGASDAAQGSTWFTSSDYEKGIKVVKKMGDPLIKLSEFVKQLDGITEDEIALVGLKTRMIIKTLTGAFTQKDDEGNTLKPSDMQFISRSYSSIATSYTKMTKSFIDFKDGINDLDIEKVTEVRKLYEGLAALSQNGGENVIEQMAEMLVDVIEALTGAVDTMNSNNESSTLDKTKQSVSGSTAPSPTTTTTTSANTSNPELLKAISMLTRRLDGILYVEVAGGSQLR